MSRAATWLGQALLYGLFALVIGLFSHWPTYHPLPPGQALLKVSFIHHGERVAQCRPFTPAELAKLPPNMRAPMKCERERSPVTIELDLDGATVYRQVAAPAGLSRDGASAVYHRVQVAAGEHRIAVRLKDRSGGAFTHAREATVTLKPAQVLVIDFDPQKGITLS
ncbi:hypothetical protein [Ramlibacter sp.]|uniref:hypothetical protein n=1 Tax=Ramlibacter sp. TaxID=1917967 RepID=UPI002C139D00|nr:hypothetical protein [Ramlibacter sp.]HWI83478.1 hypothetical protein [Ramlibacter sp.]